MSHQTASILGLLNVASSASGSVTASMSRANSILLITTVGYPCRNKRMIARVYSHISEKKSLSLEAANRIRPS